MNVVVHIVRLVVAVILVAGLVGLSNVGLRARTTDDALLRLSWRAAGRRVQACRTPTQAELDALPVHMRSREICEGRLEPLPLEVRIDGSVVIDRELHAAGAREDRPIFVFEELALSPGVRRIAIEFGRPPENGKEGIPQRRLSASVNAAPGLVFLVTTESETGDLVLVDRIPGVPVDRD